MAHNRIAEAFRGNGKVLSIYLTAGYPNLDDTADLCTTVARSGADMIEIGIPFSDPVADGPVIQASGEQALKNGMTLERLFSQLAVLRSSVSIPILLMGYLNPVLQFGKEKFASACASAGIDGVIIPDLPFEEYLSEFREAWAELAFIPLVTPQTPAERISFFDQHTKGFIYAVSSPAITGDKLQQGQEMDHYLERLGAMQLQNPLVVGFGIATREDFVRVTKHTQGGIIGSAFIRALSSESFGPTVKARAQAFVSRIKV